jgi:vibriolysin
MIKTRLITCLLLGSSCAFSANDTLRLHHAPISSIAQFDIVGDHTLLHAAKPTSNSNEYVLHEIATTHDKNQHTTIKRYQQTYHNIPIVGAQIMMRQSTTQPVMKQNNISGHVIQNISLSTTPALASQEALVIAKNNYFNKRTSSPTDDEHVHLEIRADKTKSLRLVYLVSFRTMTTNHQDDVWLKSVIDAQTGEILTQWNNIQHYTEKGTGGNEKTHEYWYGHDDIPGLSVIQQGERCVMKSERVSVVDLHHVWDFSDRLTTPFEYTCAHLPDDSIHGAFSPRNDAYYFGHVITDMYENWYGLHPLQTTSGKSSPLIMRVHFGENFDNAFWNGTSMSFGDGENFYPLVSLDIAGHEITHGFTEQHANLEYHDQSGALNEAMSDMAGLTTRYYLLETAPLIYNKLNLTPNEITWTIGETIIPDESAEKMGMNALRFMDFPSKDSMSADCLDKKLARRHKGLCAIDYNDVVNMAEDFSKTFGQNDEEKEDIKQSIIVHSASGIFNKAFYLISQTLGIKTTYHMMLTANIYYWTPNTDFTQGACGVLYAADDLEIDNNPVKAAFEKVGIDINQCQL